jgi:hypothetical protein
MILIFVLLPGFGRLTGLLRVRLALLAALALLLARLLAGLRLVLVALLLQIVLARLVLVGHVMNSMEWGYPSPFLNPCRRSSFRRNAPVPTVS